MGLHRKMGRNPASTMFAKRMGGKVSLFNYNPSIAGGAIAVKRHKTGHRLGHIHRGGVIGTNLNQALLPNVTTGAAAFLPTNACSGQEARKRVRAEVGKHLDNMSKRMRQ